MIYWPALWERTFLGERFWWLLMDTLASDSTSLSSMAVPLLLTCSGGPFLRAPPLPSRQVSSSNQVTRIWRQEGASSAFIWLWLWAQFLPFSSQGPRSPLPPRWADYHLPPFPCPSHLLSHHVAYSQTVCWSSSRPSFLLDQLLRLFSQSGRALEIHGQNSSLLFWSGEKADLDTLEWGRL